MSRTWVLPPPVVGESLDRLVQVAAGASRGMLSHQSNACLFVYLLKEIHKCDFV